MTSLEAMLNFGAPVTTTTIRGSRVTRTATPTPEFWQLWRTQKDAVRALGVNPKLVGDSWIVIHYMDTPATPATPVAATAPAAPASSRTWSAEQESIFAWFKSSGESRALVVRARAGTGKTTTIKHAFTLAPEDRMLYAVFNKKNQREASEAIVDPRVDVKTLHSVGFTFIQSVWPGVKPTDDVEVSRVEKVVGENTPVEVRGAVRRLVGFAKNTTVDPTVEQLAELAIERDIDCEAYEAEENGGWNVAKLAAAAHKVMEISKVRDAEGRVSFNDMVWLPVAMRWVRPSYDLVVVDEAQDMSLPQLLMAKGAVTAEGRICVVGDDRQAIYGFRGATSDGIDMMKTTLNATELGLTTTYRCPKAVVALAAALVPDYKAAPTAPDGLVTYDCESKLPSLVKVGDVVLSRANSPLMPLCLQLLRQGVPARIEGKDIGKMLAAIVKKLNARTVPQFISRLTTWGDKQKSRLQDTKNFEEKAQEIDDQVDTLTAVAEGASSVTEILNRLATLFSDTDSATRPSVVLSTAHRAKGLEWDKVYLLADTFRNKKPANGAPESPEVAAAKAKENANVYYVALTRAKRHLVLVSKA